MKHHSTNSKQNESGAGVSPEEVLRKMLSTPPEPHKKSDSAAKPSVKKDAAHK